MLTTRAGIWVFAALSMAIFGALPVSAQTKIDQARVYELLAIQRAQELGNTAVAIDGRLQLGRILFNLANYEGAVAEYDAYLQLSSNTVRMAEALYESGLALCNQQYYSAAIARWKQVVNGYRYSPMRVLAYMKMGQTQFGLAQYDQAVATFQTVMANYPNSPEAQEASYFVIQSYYNKGDLSGSAQQFIAFKNRYSADSRLQNLCELLPSAHEGQTKGNAPSGSLSQLLRACPGTTAGATVIWERGAEHFNKKEYAWAQKFFQSLLLSWPTSEHAPQASFYIAESYFHQGLLDQAAAAYKSFYINYSNDARVPQAMFQVGVSFFNKKEYDKSAAAFGEFLKRFPQHELSRDAALNVALSHRRAFRLTDAIGAYKNYARLFPNDPREPSVRLQIGILQNQLGHFEQAIQSFGEVPATSPERLEAQYHLGGALASLKREAEAEQAYRKLLDLQPRKSDYRIAGLLELTKLLEKKNAPADQLKKLYQEILASTDNPNLRAPIEQRLLDIGASSR